MKKTLKKLVALSTLAAALSPTNMSAQEFTRGYTAVQGNATPTQLSKSVNEATVRTYHNEAIEGNKVALRGQGLNEVRTNGYNFGRNTARFDIENVPIQLIVANRYLNGEPLDLAVGGRVDTGKLPFLDYGFVDVLKHTGVGTQNYTGLELTSFAGKKIGPITLENTTTYKPQLEMGAGPKLFIEGEAIGLKLYENKHVRLQPVGRVEHNKGLGTTASGGIQVTFK